MAVFSRKWVAAAVGVAAIGAAAAQPPKAGPGKPAGGTTAPAADVVRSADPLGAMLSDAKAAYAKVRDYTCVFTRQERVNGALGAEQVAELKVRTTPHSVAVRFARPEAVAGMEMVYLDGSRTGKMKFRPAGAKGVSTVLQLSPDDPKVMAETRHPVTAIGIGPTIDRLAKVAAVEKSLGNPVEVYPSDFLFAGRAVTRYEILTRRPHAHRYAYRCLVYVDKETKLPVRFEAYDAPKTGTATGELLEAYSYTNLKTNVGLGDSAFR